MFLLSKLFFFCVISQEQQRGGYGSRLMSRLKKWCQENNNFNLLTYADDTAIGYFQRQGFSVEITEMDVKDWDIGFLKYYDGATLMHCSVDPRIDYLDITHQIRLQRAMFCKKMRSLSLQHIAYDGLPKKTDKHQHFDPSKIQGLVDSGWTRFQLDKLLDVDVQEKLYKENKAFVESIKNDRHLSEPFLKPVLELHPDISPDYYLRIIHNDPIDLRTISEKLEKRWYICHEMVLADLQRMVDNCKLYLTTDYTQNKQKNVEKNPVYLLAEAINTRFLEKRRADLGISLPIIREEEI